MRKLLVLTSRPLDSGVEETLRLAGWSICCSGSAGQAKEIIAKESPLVGLLLMWPEDAPSLKRGYSETVSAFPRLKWVAAFGVGQMDEGPCVSMAAEQLFDFVSLPLDTIRLLVILGHAYGMAQVSNRFVEVKNQSRQARLGSGAPMITPEDPILDQDESRATPISLQEARIAAERRAITTAIRRNKHNMTRAAEELRISRMTLYRLLRKHELQERG